MVEEIKIICETVKDLGIYVAGAWVMVAIIRSIFGRG